MLCPEPFQKILVFAGLLATGKGQIVLKGMVAGQIANNTEYLTPLSLALEQRLLAVIKLALEEHADLHLVETEDEVADDDLRSEGALWELARFIIVEDGFGDFIFYDFAGFPFPEIASRVIFLLFR